MDVQQLPEEFLSSMRRLLGDDFQDFLESYGSPRLNGLRLNRRKISPAGFERMEMFHHHIPPGMSAAAGAESETVSETKLLSPRVPWTDNGYYSDYKDRPGQHPYYHAGLYYLQEPSAMLPAALLPLKAGDRVLDLCAAPGGKATELGARLSELWERRFEPVQASKKTDAPVSESRDHAACHDTYGSLMPGGLLVANEISASRARALLHNIELFGIPNAVVLNETPARLAERFPEYFDAVLVDAPCSGEGMFRKDPDAVKTWSREKVLKCAEIQRDIIVQAADMLRPGGYMVYSTCTFEPQEDELVLLHLLDERPEMELVPLTGDLNAETAMPGSGSEAAGNMLSPAFSASKLTECGYDAPDSDVDTTFAVRIWPHKAKGEGHFIALLRKKKEILTGGGPDFARDAGSSFPVQAAAYTAQKSGGRRSRDLRNASSSRGSAKKNGAGSGFTREELNLVTDFIKQFIPDERIDINQLENHSGQVYMMPYGLPDLRGLRILRCGLFLGSLKKNRFEPSQELAMALPDNCGHMKRISFSADDPRTEAYLRGEPVKADMGSDILQGGSGTDNHEAGGIPTRPFLAEKNKYTAAGRSEKLRDHMDRTSDTIKPENGWYLVCADGNALGWGKLSGDTLKNKLAPGWRIQ